MIDGQLNDDIWRNAAVFGDFFFKSSRAIMSRRRVRPQPVVGWTPSLGTALYAGYNDDLNYNGYNPYTGLNEPGFRGNGRTFFIKASYLFRKSF